MKDKICLITGATSGIGFVTALELAVKGATVIVCGRDQEKTANAVLKIRKESNNPKVDFLVADLSDFEQVKKLAGEFINTWPKLDVLVNNAGGIFREFDLNRQNIEMTMALNVFSVYLLTGLLSGLLKSSAPSRIINVSSMAHKMGNNNFDILLNEKNYKAFQAYSNSKLALMHLNHEMHTRLSPSGVCVNVMHPGWVKTGFAKDYQAGLIGVMEKMMHPFQLTPEQGAQTIVYLAESDEVAGISGKYFIKMKEASPSSAAMQTEISAKMWTWCEKMTHYKWS
ncbi:MAG: SDR family oxidoreductase [Bacteroidales bacterium]